MKWLPLLLLVCVSCGTSPGEPLEIRVLCYNVKRGLGNDGSTDIGRTAELINELQPDLVALQEIDHGVRRSGGIDQMVELERLTGLSARFGAFMPYQGGDYGIGLLSRYPILGARNHPLPKGLEPRTALDARVRLPGGEELIFCSVHLYCTEAERLAQAERLVAIYREAEAPMILAGDFNSEPGSTVMALVDEHWRNTDKGEDRMTFSATEPVKEIDFILHRPATRFEVLSIDVLDEPLISDHRPVLMVLKLHPPGSRR